MGDQFMVGLLLVRFVDANKPDLPFNLQPKFVHESRLHEVSNW